jgi:hypothetical protein
MWTRIWKGLSNSGVNDQLLPSESRYVVLVNRFGIISGLVTLFCLLLLLIELPERGFSTTRLFLVGKWVIADWYNADQQIPILQLSKVGRFLVSSIYYHDTFYK